MKNKILYIIAQDLPLVAIFWIVIQQKNFQTEVSGKQKQMRKWPFLIFIDVFPLGI